MIGNIRECLATSFASSVDQGAHSENLEINDVMGDFSLTLVDALDTFVVMGDHVGALNSSRPMILSNTLTDRL